MREMREIYQALLDGKTLVHNSGVYLTLENSTKICIGEPEQWSIYNEWEMKPTVWWVRNNGLVGWDVREEVTLAQKFGMRYHTKEAAERARDEMKEANLLRYWVSVIDPDWKADWDNTEQNKYYVYENPGKEYKYEENYTARTLGTVYMSKEAVTKICNALNSGELTLD